MIADFGGIAGVIPVFTGVFLFVTLSSIGLPGLNGFVGEFLILGGIVERLPGRGGVPPGSASSSARSTCCGWCSGVLGPARQRRQPEPARPHRSASSS